MGQITTGIRSVLNNPGFYMFFQDFFGEQKWQMDFVANFVRPCKGDKILDIGCGPAGIFKHLSHADYWGFDISEVYIRHAKKKYGDAGHFFCKELTLDDLECLPRFDIAIAIGVLHHVNDSTAGTIIEFVHRALKPGGRLITVDACFEVGQNPLARFLISCDRGQNVRTREGYAALISRTFPKKKVEVRHSTGIPYTHCFMECTRT